MRVYNFFPTIDRSNTYLLAKEGSSEGILLDPGVMDQELLNLIEDKGIYIRHVLLTTTRFHHRGGIPTLLKIYDAQVYASPWASPLPFPSQSLKDRGEVAGLNVEAIFLRGASPDYCAYAIGDYLFTGDILSAGWVNTDMKKEDLVHFLRELKEALWERDPRTIIFPGHGPPSTLESEKPLIEGTLRQLLDPASVELP